MRSQTLKVRRFLQEPGCCGIAAAASTANFYDSEVNYSIASRICKNDGEGLFTPDIARLCNRLGFTKVTIISADIGLLDFEWAHLKKPDLIQQLKRSYRYNPDPGSRESAGAYVKFLTDRDHDNDLIIDLHFGKYIRKHLSQGKPVLASFNWNLFFEFPKWNEQGKPDPIKGEFEEHEVVIVGYDNNGVDIVDSHHEMYQGKLSKYRSGRYRMDWETLHTVMGFGDLILADKHVPVDLEEYELV
jgi:hypothetical protein